MLSKLVLSVLVCIVCIALLGCSAEKRFQKQKKKATDFFLLNRPELADLCNREFPDIPIKVVPGDLKVKTITPKQLYNAIAHLINTGRMDEGGLGLYETFVHFDCRGKKARWDYSNKK